MNGDMLKAVGGYPFTVDQIRYDRAHATRIIFICLKTGSLAIMLNQFMRPGPGFVVGNRL